MFWCGACAYGRMSEKDDAPIGVPGKVREAPEAQAHKGVLELYSSSAPFVALSLPSKLVLTLLSCASQKGTCLGGALMWFTGAFGTLSSLDSMPTCGLIGTPHAGIITTAVADNAIRTAENIEGSWFGDLCNAFFCRPCAQCRQAREVDLKGQ